MKKYNLKCKNGHSFDGYFNGICSAKRQLSHGQVTCIECGTSKVTKAELYNTVQHRSVDNTIKLPDEKVESLYALQNQGVEDILRVIDSTLTQSRSFDA